MTDATPEDTVVDYEQMDEQELADFVTGSVLFAHHEGFHAGVEAGLALVKLVDAGITTGNHADFNAAFFTAKRDESRESVVDRLFPIPDDDNEEGPKEGEVQGSAGSDAAEGAVDTETG